MEMLDSAICWHISWGVYIGASVDIYHLDYPRIPRRLCHPTGKMDTICSLNQFPSIHSRFFFSSLAAVPREEQQVLWSSFIIAMLRGKLSCSLHDPSLHCHCTWSPTIKMIWSTVKSAHVTIWLCMAVQRARKQLLKSLDHTQEGWEKKKKRLWFTPTLCVPSFPLKTKRGIYGLLALCKIQKHFHFCKASIVELKKGSFVSNWLVHVIKNRISEKTWLPWNMGRTNRS